MSKHSSEDPVFDDDEVRKILSDASEPVEHEGGLALSELKAIGEEVGIDPSRVEKAARSAISARVSEPSVPSGSGLVRYVERTVPGPLTPAKTAEALALIRQRMGHHGNVTEVGGVLEWNAASEVIGRHISISLDSDPTTIRGTTNLKSAASMTALPAGLLSLLMSGVVAAGDGPATGAIIFLILAPILFFVTHLAFRGISKAEQAKLDDVTESLTRLIEESGS